MTPDAPDFNSLSKKQLVELVIVKYNDCFRLVEENKKLKLENAKLKDRIITDENFEEKLDKENKKLKEDIADMDKEYMALLNDYKHLKAKIEEMSR